MRDVLVVGAAPASHEDAFYRALLDSAESVIAADAAGEWCVRLGRVPDLTVGDFDSAEPDAASRLREMGSAVVGLPADKDVSDLDACVEQARAHGAKVVTLTAAFRGRVDHTLAAFGSALRAADLAVTIREPGWTAWVVLAGGEQIMPPSVPHGTVVSVLSPTGASGVTITGGRYALIDAKVEPLSSLGISNVITGERFRVSVADGAVIVIAAAEAK
jgi:thiamine pyrophosphokinase